ncbi:hypothetical protein [Arsenophonus nasoniae]|uniref:Lipoprotein n=1 Tax=Arsenophonus nasoniae TaxID=638 RepID=A0AA95GJP4_9GAMM|nr:hypothetical protein [Arsenophonus nasoniae]WGM00273.1 hypothetical protein QE210_10290 [Arsenophonus nasoniae]
MKLLYKASIIILFGCYSISSIANNTQMPLTTKNTDNIRYHKNRYHSYEQINAIMGRNFNEARAMLQQNLDFAKESVNENLN